MSVRNERGERIAEGRPWDVPMTVLNQMDTPLLLGVDPYGNTVFNGWQVRHQIPSELIYLRGHLADPHHDLMFADLERLIAVSVERPHRYLWFVGD